MVSRSLSWLRNLSQIHFGILTMGIAWIGIVISMAFMTQGMKSALMAGLVFLMPLIFAVVITQRFLVVPAKRKLAVEKDWAHPRTSAITAGIFISFLTVLIMMVVCTIGYGAWNAMQSPEGLATLIDPAKFLVNVIALIYVTGIGVVLGSWIWIPIGVVLAYWMQPARSGEKSSIS